MTSPIAGEREATPALEVVRMLEDMCKFADQSDGKLSTSLVREYIGDLRAALLEPVGEGWRTIAVNSGFDALFEALERAQSKGYMPDAMADEWEAFDYREIAASPKSKYQP